MKKTIKCNSLTNKREAHSALLARLSELKRGADHDSPLALTPLERDFINQLSKKANESSNWTPSSLQINKVNELWNHHFE